MKVVTWNVNSLNVRLEHVIDWIKSNKPDILCIQETKQTNEKFAHDAFSSIGYESYHNGQKTYNGVALLSRTEGLNPISDIPGFDDHQRRVLAATYGDTRIVNLYVPNGQALDSDKYQYKLDWLKALNAWVREEANQHAKLCVFGDFNIAPEDTDVHDPEAWAGKILCSDAERAALAELTSLGLQDSFRLFDQPPESFSWWDYRMAGFRRNRGLRIDLILVSEAIAKRSTAGGIDKEPRALERPSDHAPVWLAFD